MQTRRDQVQAYRFAQTRMRSALLTGETDRPEPPLRRSGVSTFAGLMVAVLVTCGFGIYGLYRPGYKHGWNERGVLIVERETGARFVYDPADDALHPVLNYTSARLILGEADITVREFTRASLRTVRRGAPRGLAGLPDALPAPAGLVRGPWVVCSSPTADGGAPAVSVSIGTPPTGRHVTSESALLVRAPDGATYLLWNDTRLLVRNPRTVLAALGLDGTAPLPVSGTWLNAVAPGPDLTSPLPLDIGSSVGYQVGAQKVYLGQVFKVALEGGIDAAYYVVLKDGLAKISNVVALLLLGDPTMRYAYGKESPHAYTAQAADVNAAPKASSTLAVNGFPQNVPQLLATATDDAGRASSSVCSAYTTLDGSSMSSSVYLSDAVPGAGRAATAVPGQQVRVAMPPGSACVARLLPHPGQGSDAVFLVTELGVKYAVPPGDVRNVLGYGAVTPVPVPQGVLDLVPSGPALDPGLANSNLPALSASADAG